MERDALPESPELSDILQAAWADPAAIPPLVGQLVDDHGTWNASSLNLVASHNYLSPTARALLDIEKVKSVAADPGAYELIEETPELRVLKPARRARRHHVVVESKQPAHPIAELYAKLAEALFEAARRAAGDFAAAGVATRIVCEVDPAGAGLVRIQVVSTED